MQEGFRIVPKLYYYDTFRKFHEEFKLGERDVLVTNEWMYKPYVESLNIKTNVIFQERFGKGEPSDEMIDAMNVEIKKYDFDRIIAFGGGTIVDICKVLALRTPDQSVKLFTGETPTVKEKELIVVPTTCGTGSEVTNVAIAELKNLHVKKGLASEETYADAAVLIPESLQGLPDYVFATSSIDALIHAAESYLSPKASAFTELYSVRAIEMILNGYRDILKKGNTAEERLPYLKEFAFASNYAGIAFGNAGCAAVHAMSYSIGGEFHVPHGEANYQFFTEVFRVYMEKMPDGKIRRLNRLFAEALDCDTEAVYEELEKLLGRMISKKPLREYGMKPEQIEKFTEMTVQNQQRLLANNYVPLSKEDIREMFARLY